MTDPSVPSVRIDAAPATVAAAVASPHGLAVWLCDEATSQKRPGGPLSLAWNDGRHLPARWVDFAPPERLSWAWRQEGAAADTVVRFEVRPAGDGTDVVVDLDGGFGDGEGASRAWWQTVLQDLKAYVETGRNARFERRPMMGIGPHPVTPALAAERGLAVDKGILIDSVMDDMGAARAGVQAGDVLTAIDELPTDDWSALGAALAAHAAGDKVRLSLYRGSEPLSLEVELSGRPVREVPADAGSARALAVEAVDQMIEALDGALAGVSEAEAAAVPAPGEWNVRQVLAHLVLGERISSMALSRLATDESPIDWAQEADNLRERALAALPLDALRARLVADLEDSRCLIEMVLEGTPTAAVVRYVAEGAGFGVQHFQDHVEQIRAAVAAARGTTG